MRFIIVSIFLAVYVAVFLGCLSKIDRPDAPSCCQSLYDVLYLTQKSGQPINAQSLMDCCRQMQKIDFCKRQDDPTMCVKLMTTF